MFRQKDIYFFFSGNRIYIYISNARKVLLSIFFSFFSQLFRLTFFSFFILFFFSMTFFFFTLFLSFLVYSNTHPFYTTSSLIHDSTSASAMCERFRLSFVITYHGNILDPLPKPRANYCFTHVFIKKEEKYRSRSNWIVVTFCRGLRYIMRRGWTPNYTDRRY